MVCVGLGVASTACCQVGFDANHNDGGNHCHETRQRRVAFAEEIWQAWIRQGLEGHWQQVHEGSCQQDACSNMLAVEDDVLLSFSRRGPS
jgi:hypothetical protein